MLRDVLLPLLLMVSAPDTALALGCIEDGDCPEFFECGDDGHCRELSLECTDGCPAHLSCAPTTTTNTGEGEPAPSGFRCAWVDRQCIDTPCEHAGFECVECESASGLPCQHCVPSRIACNTHADCPEFFHCFDFSAEELPEYWPAGAGRACKPLLGPFPYAPEELAAGELTPADGGDTGAGGVVNAGPATTGGNTTNSGGSATTAASTVSTTAAASGGAGGTDTAENSSTATSASTSGEAAADPADTTLDSNGCSCAVAGIAPRGGFTLGWVLLAIYFGCRRLRSSSRSAELSPPMPNTASTTSTPQAACSSQVVTRVAAASSETLKPHNPFWLSKALRRRYLR